LVTQALFSDGEVDHAELHTVLGSLVRVGERRGDEQFEFVIEVDVFLTLHDDLGAALELKFGVEDYVKFRRNLRSYIFH